jgi:aldose 1-epimerase
MRVRIGHPGLTAEIWTRGAALNALEVPDGSGGVESIVLGCRDEAARDASPAYLGEIVGPFGNRIEGASFTLDGRTHALDPNFVGKHTLHGGRAGFSRCDWTVVDRSDDAVTLRLDWSDEAGSHPGPIEVLATYRVAGATLTLITEARSDAPTVANVVGHPYFTLQPGGTVDDHVLQIAASSYVAVDAEAIPLAESPVPVEAEFDLRAGRALADSYASSHPQLLQFGGFDHCWVLDGEGMRPVASLTCVASGRRLLIETDQPGLQVYGGMGLGEPATIGPDGPYEARSGVALETQNLPNAPHRPDFPSSVLRPGEVQRAEVRWTIDTL